MNLVRIGYLLSLLMIPSLSAAEGEVFIPDPQLEAAVREWANKPTGTITSNDMAGMVNLVAESRGITNLTGLEAAVNVDYVGLRQNNITDITPLLGLRRLRILTLDWNKITNISGIGAMQSLEVLTLTTLPEEEMIQDLTPVSGLTNLNTLNVGWNPTSSFTFSNLPALSIFGANVRGDADLSFLTNFPSLTQLAIGPGVSNIAPIAFLTNLIVLSLRENSITDITPLNALNITNFYLLSVEFNAIDLNRESPSRATLERFRASARFTYFNGQRYTPRLRIKRAAGSPGAELEFDGDAWTIYLVQESTDLENWYDTGMAGPGLELQPRRFPINVSGSANVYYRLLGTFLY